MQDHLGHDRLQMGGQGGIIANVMAVSGVKNVYVHCASHPSSQAALFLDRPNLLAVDAEGRLSRAATVNRATDLPLIHWILEFDKDAELKIGGLTLKCPKSNRFIATYDPLNFILHIDPGFDSAMEDSNLPLEFVLLSGYQMLNESTLSRVDDSAEKVALWRTRHAGCRVHFEFASTQDMKVRQALATRLAPKMDSVGFNEQEEIQILEALGETALARECASLDSVSLFKGLLKIHSRFGIGRVQLHMFGLYMTLADPKLDTPSESLRDGMVLAATLAAAKAGSGSLESEDNLLWAHGRAVADHSLKELRALSDHLKKEYGKEGFEQDGIFEGPGFRLVAVPTILIDKPVTLVGMGDTISSLSLVGAR
jgi:ADP-dependent phosphofructokinase/glucokinase